MMFKGLRNLWITAGNADVTPQDACVIALLEKIDSLVMSFGGIYKNVL